MHKYIIIIGLVIIGFTSCKKDDQAKIDNGLIQNYITQNKLDSVQKDPSGLYYKIITPGTGAYPNINSRVTVTYKGSLLNGNVFAPTDDATSLLAGFIAGWQVGIPHINAGGTILLLIPSALGYGSHSPTGSNIPNNSVLVFTVTLTSFQ